MAGMATLYARITDALHTRIKTEAEARRMPMVTVVSILLEAQLDQLEKEKTPRKIVRNRGGRYRNV